MTRHPYASAMLAKEGPDALAPLLAAYVRFDSAALHRPFAGKDAVLRLLPVLRGCFDDVEITDEFTADGSLSFVFSGRIGGRDVNGLQLVRFDSSGLIERVTGMVRPLTGLIALTEAMAPHVVTLADGTHDIAAAGGGRRTALPSAQLFVPSSQLALRPLRPGCCRRTTIRQKPAPMPEIRRCPDGRGWFRTTVLSRVKRRAAEVRMAHFSAVERLPD
jgi:hypothetical protein